MHIRGAELSDISAIVTLEACTLPAEAWGEVGFQSHLLHGGILLVAVDEEEVCGFVAAHGAVDEWEIYKIAVNPLFRRHGVGLQLLEELFQRCPGHYFLEVRASNSAAQALYARAGFTQSGERQGYYPDGETALLYHT